MKHFDIKKYLNKYVELTDFENIKYKGILLYGKGINENEVLENTKTNIWYYLQGSYISFRATAIKKIKEIE